MKTFKNGANFKGVTQVHFNYQKENKEKRSEEISEVLIIRS